MEENATALAMQSSGVKPRPVIVNAPKLVQLRLILVDPDAQANVRLGSPAAFPDGLAPQPV